MGKFLARHLLFESIILLALFSAFWMITRVLPGGELSYIGREAAKALGSIPSYFPSVFVESDAVGSIGGISSTRPWPEKAALSGFCGIGNFAGIYVKNSSALSYFVIIPAFLIVMFAYNRSTPEAFSRPGRALFSTILISLVIVITFKVIELQEIQATIVSSPGDNFYAPGFSYGCELKSGPTDVSVATVALFLGNLSAFLGEIRLYLLGLVLWIIGREHADIRRLQKLSSDQPTDREPNET